MTQRATNGQHAQSLILAELATRLGDMGNQAVAGIADDRLGMRATAQSILAQVAELGALLGAVIELGGSQG